MESTPDMTGWYSVGWHSHAVSHPCLPLKDLLQRPQQGFHADDSWGPGGAALGLGNCRNINCGLFKFFSATPIILESLSTTVKWQQSSNMLLQSKWPFQNQSARLAIWPKYALACKGLHRYASSVPNLGWLVGWLAGWLVGWETTLEHSAES